MSIAQEAARRRTYAVISHPDAGKTTFTEKVLLYSGAIHLAGSVRARKAVRHAVSDWMKMEQERGISITSSVLQFEYEGAALNLVDTPGHADFSEDTYRTLAAVDSAVMLIDHTKGVESRTRKLFEVCRLRQLPIITFMNKLDRPGRDPLELIDDVASSLNLKVAPLNWPLGMGTHFAGVVDVRTRRVTLFSGGDHGQQLVAERDVSLDEAREVVGDELVDEVSEQLELLEVAGDSWDLDGFLRGEVSPVFWGSAMTNFGVQPILDFIAASAASPGPRFAVESGEDEELLVEPTSDGFSAFVFKIQANMNPRHRDRVAFLRVVSGRFERGMDATVGRSGETFRLAKPHSFMASERSIVDEAWPGDIVGLYDPGKLRIGDTLAVGRRLSFSGIPRFAPEHFARIALENPLKRKQLDRGLTQLAYEGVVQVFVRPEVGVQDAWLGAVGMLQFEVLRERLNNEYGVQVRLEPLRFTAARWIGGSESGKEWLRRRTDLRVVVDNRTGSEVLLAESTWAIDYALRQAEGLELYDVEPL
jgi:peptide chain release factor 3